MHSYPSLPYKVSPRGIHAHACELRLQAKLKFKAFGERYATSAGVAPWNEKWNKYKGKLIIAASCSVTDGGLTQHCLHTWNGVSCLPA